MSQEQLNGIFVDSKRMLATDMDGNIAYFDHFYGAANFNEEKAEFLAIKSLESLIDCKGCVNSSDLIGHNNIIENNITYN